MMISMEKTLKNITFMNQFDEFEHVFFSFFSPPLWGKSHPNHTFCRSINLSDEEKTPQN